MIFFSRAAFSIILAAAISGTAVHAAQNEALTYCNPINIDYQSNGHFRHAADPALVLFKGKYYLFDTFDLKGYRVSDDLVHWKDILFNPKELPEITGGGTCLAPAVAVHDGYIYYINLGVNKTNAIPNTSNVMRTSDPLSGNWDLVGTVKPGGDPNLFFDDDGRIYETTGLGSTGIVELNPKTFADIPGTQKTILAPDKSPGMPWQGIIRFNPDLSDHVDTSAYLNALQPYHVREGSWITKYDGTYYLQVSSPGTETIWYHDDVYESKNIDGPYKAVDSSPASMKVGGFIGSSGHSGVFQDKYGNYWRITTMWIGVKDHFERRLGLFPTGFDKEGRMLTQTTLGDYPMVMPDAPRSIMQSPLAGWWVQSYNKTCTASSSLPDHAPQLASDEDIRTWWSAQTGNPGEWLQMDLGKKCRINAIQINFAEQDISTVADPNPDDYYAYKLLASDDGKTWRTIIDKSANTTCVPADYVPFAQPVNARYLKLVNVHMALGGKFAISDLRVFGNGGGKAPAEVQGLTVQRHPDDDRDVTFTWIPTPSADGYLIRYGVAPDALYSGLQIVGGNIASETMQALTHGVHYFYRIDAYNDNGVTIGKVIQDHAVPTP